MDDLARFLRPAGGGIYTVTTGRQEREALQRTIYGARDADDVQRRWEAALAGVERARVAVLGIPSDCGAGLVRGAAFGPEGVRRALLRPGPRLQRARRRRRDRRRRATCSRCRSSCPTTC